MKKVQSREASAIILRDLFRDFRSARGFLDAQSKYINSFLHVSKTPNDLSVRDLNQVQIRGMEDFKAWQRELVTYWNKKRIVDNKLRASYQNIFEFFMGTFDDALNCAFYSMFLKSQVSQYIDSRHLENQINEMEEVVWADSPDLENFEPITIEIDIKGGEVIFNLFCNPLTEKKAANLRFKLISDITHSKAFGNMNFGIALLVGKPPVIQIRMNDRQSEDTIRDFFEFLSESMVRNKDDENA